VIKFAISAAAVENEGKTLNQQKKELLSLSGSMDLDNASYDEIEDEMVRGGLDRVKVSINGVAQNKANPKSH
jgi:hypothetical protein